MPDGYVPPKAIQQAAARGLELRRKFNRGGTAVGVARARDLSNGKAIPLDTIKRMVSFFARHAVDAKADGWGNNSDPSPGWVAHLLWGGDDGKAFANRILKQAQQKQESKSMTSAFIERAHTGVMVAFFLDPISAAKLSQLIPGGESIEDLHLTLGYYGKADRVGDRNIFTQTVADYARECRPIQAMADGLIRFCALDEMENQPICASVSSPALSDCRHELIEELEEQGFEVERTHGFQPHVTLAYVPRSRPSPIQVLPEPVSVRFDTMTVAWADERVSFRMGEDKLTVNYPWANNNSNGDGYVSANRMGY